MLGVNTPMKRSRAKLEGLKHYFTGKLCRNGHSSHRFVSNGGCSECLRLDVLKYQSKHREELLPKKLAWAKNNPEKNRAQSSRWSKENNDKAKAIHKNCRNKKPEHYRPKYAFSASKRKAALLQRTPFWVDMEAIKLVYKNCPSGMAVDHIVPLQGKNVSGLHVHWNMQYLTKSENSRKGANFENLC